MKKRVLLLMTTMLLIVCASGYAQDVPAGVIVAFKRGNSAELEKYLSDSVELVILNRTSTVNKATAESSMHTFFMDNKVSDFNVNHQGKRNESSFVIGTLSTSTGSYRVNCFMKRIQNKNVIHQIRIDKTNE